MPRRRRSTAMIFQPRFRRPSPNRRKGATIRGYSTEVEKGKRLYEAQLTVNGHSKDISMDASGNILAIEEEVSGDSLPTNVKEALTKAAGAGTITKVESIAKNGKLVAYEAA